MIHRVSKHCVLRGKRPTKTVIHDKIHTLPKFKSLPCGSPEGRPVAPLYKMADLDDVPLLPWPPQVARSHTMRFFRKIKEMDCCKATASDSMVEFRAYIVGLA
ncbi:hypothetical protein AVEN_119469-1 [Araneus ventricosus]|uniref:Uncharacterized protein n=1 Tax=Araneus ventricosus TaxID=182803 RepID=A0A4Y2DNK1_ARAVE|nr:hypothetical protein AVEN_119469-1 [Araneus ventricosus]